MKLKFTKMQGAGNDYIYIDCFNQKIENPETLAIRLSDRHFGIGSDGLVLILPSEGCDARMRMFNADGSEGNMCGNAIRCVGKYLYEQGIVRKTVMKIETRSGEKELKMILDGNHVTGVTVDMGKAVFDAAAIPVSLGKKKVVFEPLEIGGRIYHVTCVSMGNPHCVVFCEDVDRIELEKIGPLFENHIAFPERINTEFVQFVDGNSIKMRVWERGSGETLACGTGACASVAACVENDKCRHDEKVTVFLRGGKLEIVYRKDGTLMMTGPAETVFDGEVET